MSLRVYVEGRPRRGGVSPADRRALADMVATLIAPLSWGCETFQIPVDPLDSDAVQVSTQVQADHRGDTWRDLCQCVAIAWWLSRRRPGWVWTVSDDLDLIGSAVGVPELRFRAGLISAGAEVDIALRTELDAVLGSLLPQFGIAPPQPEIGEDDSGPLGPAPQLFLGPSTPVELVPGLLLNRLSASVGPAEEGDDFVVDGDVMLENRGQVALDDLQLRLVLRDVRGRVVGSVNASADELSPGATADVSVFGFVGVSPDLVSDIELYARVGHGELVSGQLKPRWERA